MRFQQHYADDKRNANSDRYFWHKSKVSLTYNKFHCFLSGKRNATYVLSDKLKITLVTIYERPSEFARHFDQNDSFH